MSDTSSLPGSESETDEPLSDEAIAQQYTNHVDSLAQIERLLAEGGALSALGAERAEAHAVQHRDALRLLRLVQSARSQLATLAAEREEAYKNAFEIHRERYENLRDALGERYPTAEDVVGASIAAIHRGKEQCLQLSSATSELERLRAENAQLLRFAGHALKETRLHEIGDWDGGDLQQTMTTTGLLEEVAAIAPCGEGCRCVEFDDGETTCYRLTALAQRAMDSLA